MQDAELKRVDGGCTGAAGAAETERIVRSTEAECARAEALAGSLPEDEDDAEILSDYLGAARRHLTYVLSHRHDAVVAQRMRIDDGPCHDKARAAASKARKFADMARAWVEGARLRAGENKGEGDGDGQADREKRARLYYTPAV